MAINLKTLGKKVSRYRAQRQIEVAAVASSTGLDTERLRQIEQGNVEPTGDEVLILADFFHCDFRFFISDESAAPFEQAEEIYRANAKEFTASDRQSIEEFLYLCETEEFLQSEMGRTPQNRPTFNFSPKGNFYKRHGQEAAASLRQHLNLPDDAVPFDIFRLVRECGVHVFRRKLQNSGISGLFVKHPTAGNCVLINFFEDIYRQRFSAAHELGHAIFDCKKSSASVSFTQSNQNDLIEVRANRFASCLLLPPAALQALPTPQIWKSEDVINWAQHFRVSCNALAIALSESNIIDDSTAHRFSKVRIPNQSKSDPEIPINLSKPQQKRKKHLLELGLSDAYVGLCFDALHANQITAGRLAEAFLCSVHELGELAMLYGRTLNAH